MSTLYLDLETYNEHPITRGTYRYAETAEILLIAYTVDDNPVRVIDCAQRVLPAEARFFFDALETCDRVIAHNAMFDRTILRSIYPKECPPIPRWRCTMAQALAHGLPGGLDKLGAIFKVGDDKAKAKAGKALIQLFCKPRPKNMKLRRATRETHPAEWSRFVEYAAQDVEALRELHKRLPTWNYAEGSTELAYWHFDQRTNDRGFLVDTALVRGAIAAVEKAQGKNRARVSDITLGDVESATKRDALLRHILEGYGVTLPDLTADTIERRLSDEELPEAVKELLRLRLAASTSSTSKYKRFETCTSSDERMRGTIQWCGASRTGRHAGRNVQPQNFPRVSKELKNRVEPGIAAMKAGCLDLIDDDVMGVASAAIRGCIIAPDGRVLRVADLSNIEGRKVAWLAGEEWKLQAFSEGVDLYELGYAKSFGVPLSAVQADTAAGGQMRLIGKVQELALGYQGSTGAFRSMGAIYGVDVTEERALEIVRAWRRANPKIVALWYDVERAARSAIMNPGVTTSAGKWLKFKADSRWLRVRLPSGRFLCYLQPRIDEDGAISYMGVDQYTRQWKRINTFGGKLVENITQASARDVLRDASLDAEQEGFDVVLHVHDEIVAETDEHGPDDKQLAEVMSRPRAWCPGLPLAAAGYSAPRYRKG